MSKQSRFLKPTDRSENIQNKIDNTFKEVLVKNTWGLHNGHESYNLCNINEFDLLKTIVQNHPQQKLFQILDIGAGNFNLGNALNAQINNSNDLPTDIKFNIYSVRGEVNDKPIESSLEKCNHYQLGAFKIENIIEEFNKREIEPINNFDLIVSHYTMRHLVDPLGTLLQVYDMLKPGHGMLLSDGFYLAIDNEIHTLPDEAIKILKEMGIDDMLTSNPDRLHKVLEYINMINPILVYGCKNDLDQFVLVKEKDKKLELPYEYTNYKSIDEYIDCYARNVIQFKDNGLLQGQGIGLNNLGRVEEGYFRGSSQLYKFLIENKVLVHDSLLYQGQLFNFEGDETGILNYQEDLTEYSEILTTGVNPEDTDLYC